MIVGAGFSGLLAAHVFQKMPIVEAGSQGQNHKALLRFRTEDVSKLTGIPFKKVRVQKGIFYKLRFHEPNIYLANLYSKKCLGQIDGTRSIWNIDAVDRYIAPENFYEQLIDAVGNRIEWNSKANFLYQGPIINTAPMPVVLDNLGLECTYPVHFKRAPITVGTYKVPNCNAYQTVYFPSQDHGVYRASITKDILIIEMVFNSGVGNWQDDIKNSMDIDINDCQELGIVRQRYGKISEIDEHIRKKIIYRLSSDFDIFSVGRFAIWKNILLDDVVNDLNMVKKLVHVSDYDKRKMI